MGLYESFFETAEERNQKNSEKIAAYLEFLANAKSIELTGKSLREHEEERKIEEEKNRVKWSDVFAPKVPNWDNSITYRREHPEEDPNYRGSKPRLQLATENGDKVIPFKKPEERKMVQQVGRGDLYEDHSEVIDSVMKALGVIAVASIGLSGLITIIATLGSTIH